MNIKFRYLDFLKKYRFNSVLFKNFIKLMISIIIILILISMFIYKDTTKVAIDEMVSLNHNQAKRTSDISDVIFREMEYISSNIATDQSVQMYVLSYDGMGIYPDMENRLKEKIFSYTGITKYIHSIYIYSERAQHICSKDGDVSIKEFSDRGWQAEYDQGFVQNLKVIPRKINNKYPHVISFVKKVEYRGGTGYVIVNIDVSQFGSAIDDISADVSKFYIVDDNDIIIYSSNQSEFMSKISDFNLKEVLDGKSGIFKNDEGVFAAHCVKSSHYGWNYITINSLNNYDSRLETIKTKFMLMVLVFSLVSIFVSFMFALSSFKSLSNLIKVLDNESLSDEVNKLKDDETKYAASKIITIIDDNKELKSELNDRLIKYNNLQMLALQSQINPHFLNNTLNMLNSMVVKKLGLNDDISKIIIKLTRLLQYSFVVDNILVSIKDELNFLSMYVELMKSRYKNFDVQWNVDSGILENRIIRLSLQPIVENAIYHGISRNKEGGLIRICGYEEAENIVIKISDNGIGIEKEKLELIKSSLSDETFTKVNLGLKNVYRRLKTIYMAKGDLKIECTEGEGIEVSVIFPKM